MRSSCIFLLLAGLIVLVIESSESASLVQKNNELEEIKLLKELVESLKRAKDVREEDDGNGVGEDDGEDNNEDDGEDNGKENDDDDGEDNDEDNGEENDDDDGEDNGEENDGDDGEDIGEDNGEDGPEGEIETNPGDEPQVSPSDETEEGEGGTDDTDGGAEGGEQDTEIDDDDGKEEGDQGDQTTGDVTDQGAGETGTTTEGAAGPPDTNEERPSGPDRAGISKDFADYLDSIGEQVLEKVDNILDALDANELEEANANVGLLLDHLEAMFEDANVFVNFIDTVRKHLHEGKNSLEDIANAFDAAEGIIRVGEYRKPLDNEGDVESERQAKGEVGVPVARAVGVGPVQVGVPVARASVDGPIDKRAQLLREIRLLKLLKMLKDATKK